ncbi:hypothetical protein N9E81_00390 [Algibacter sp.]|nr:hypothetical protein [Algibacter sp.]
MEILIKHWTAHLNQLLYSALYFCKLNKYNLRINYSNLAPYEGGIIFFNDTSYLLDYSDSPKLLDNYKNFDFYYKRSLKPIDISNNVLPLNFQVNFSISTYSLIRKLNKKILKNPTSKTEIIRALDYFSFFVNDSHSSKNINKFLNPINDNNGKVIFLTRLWSPKNTDNILEKKRRIKQNEFRIKTCEMIKQNFKNALTGILEDTYSRKVAKSLLVDKKMTKKSNYLSLLKKSDIGIADDGLFDTPGWKIGEYILASKAIITTPINVFIDNFKENINYVKTNDRNSYYEIPDLIEALISNKKYMDLKRNNKIWYESYMEPANYISNILNNKTVCNNGYK